MILSEGHSSQYLQDYRNGKIPMGLKLGCDLDEFFVWKDSQLNIVLGHDNVGKTYFFEWYLLALATNHGKKSTIFMDENYQGRVMRDLIQMHQGKNYMSLTHDEIKRSEVIIEHYFKFVDNRRRYTPNELLDVFGKSDTDNYLIDPYNGLNTPMQYGSNYDVLNSIKAFTKEKKTVYINTHPASASGRRSAIYPAKHNWEGHVMAPLKSDSEGGKAFANKADDFIIIHRLTQHPDMWMNTMIEVAKVKDTDTGGKPTRLNDPILCDYNKGLGFKIGGVDVIKRQNSIPIEQQKDLFHKQQEEDKKKQAEFLSRVNSNRTITPDKSSFMANFKSTMDERDVF